MSEKSEAQAVELHISRPSSDQYPPPAYANQVQITYTPEDFTFHFGWYSIPPLDAPPPDGVIDAPVSAVARVVMPLNLMRNLVAVIEHQVRQYEKAFGPIPDHPNKPDWMREQEAERDV